MRKKVADRNNNNESSAEDNKLVPVIEGTYTEVPDPSSVSRDYALAIDNIKYFNSEPIYPMVYADQRKRIDQAPDLDALEQGWDGKFKYLPIEYIENRLTEVFGSGNWKQVSRTLIPTELFRNDKIIVYIDISLLIITWANGDVTKTEGIGEGRFQFNNLKSANSISNAWRIARQEGVKDAAKKLGALFGKGMKEFMNDGTMTDSTPGTDRDVILTAIGSRIFDGSIIGSTNKEIVFTAEYLETFIEHFTGETYNTLTTRGRNVITAAILSMPTLAERAEYMQKGFKLGHNFTEDTTFAEMKNTVENSETEALKDVNNVFKKGKKR